MSEVIAMQWLHDSAETVNDKDLPAHMNLTSKKVSLQGVPGFDELTYPDWKNQCRYEFEYYIIKRVRYGEIKMISSTESHVMFKNFETVEASDGSVNAQGIEVLLEKESDGLWRLIQECVMPSDEVRYDGLLN